MKQDNDYFCDGSNDPYLWPESDVLANKLGIKDALKLEQIEKDLVEGAQAYHTQYGCFNIQKKDIDTDFVKKIHYLLFSEVYEWAGQYRSVRLTKGLSIPFCYPENIENELSKLCQKAKDTLLDDISREDYIKQLAFLYNEWNAVHPFREGNGRTQRVFFQAVVNINDYYLDYTRINPETYIDLLIQAHNSVNETYLHAIFNRCLLRLECD